MNDQKVLEYFHGRVSDESIEDGRVTSIFFSEQDFTAADLNELQELTDLTSLSFRKCKLHESLSSRFHNWPGLTELSLFKCGIPNLDNLEVLEQLEELDLACTNVQDSDMATVSGLKNLSSLNLLGTSVTHEGVQYLTKLTSLKNLSLVNTNTTDMGLRYVGQLKQLRRLELESSGISDAGVESLSDLTRLNLLSLHLNPLITEDAITHLAQMNELQTLYLCVPIGPRGLRGLQKLNLNEVYIGDAMTQAKRARLREQLGRDVLVL